MVVDGAIAAKWRGDTRSTEGASVVVGAAATAVDMLKTKQQTIAGGLVVVLWHRLEQRSALQQRYCYRDQIRMPERRGGLHDRRCRSHAATSAMVEKSVVLLLLLLLFGRARTGQDRTGLS